MFIKGKEYKINILILFMEHEVDVTIAAVETLAESIETGVIISILLNGGSRHDHRILFSSSPDIRYYESPKNLGVAGGRNFLLDTEEAKTSDIIMFMDNDVVPTVDYVRSLATFLVTQENVGIVGSTLLNYYSIRPIIKNAIITKKGLFKNKIELIDNRTVKKHIKKNYSNDLFYHIGSNVDWFNAYFSSKESEDFLLGKGSSKKEKPFIPFLLYDKRYSFLYLNDVHSRIQVSNVGGGSQAFFRHLVDDIGKLNELFNPYGYEDVDFSIRAIRKGYRNFVDTNTFLLHDTDKKGLREKHFRYVQGKKEKNSLQYKKLTLLYYLHAPTQFKELSYKRMVLRFFIDILWNKPDAVDNLFYAVVGYKDAVKLTDPRDDYKVKYTDVACGSDKEINDLMQRLAQTIEQAVIRVNVSQNDFRETITHYPYIALVQSKFPDKVVRYRSGRNGKEKVLMKIIKASILKCYITRLLVYISRNKI
ncbi:MAG: glycosyltransferase [Deltaproteobacteria bacterium]|nr:glycosyltransferase [Candidatus Zymogenaceae bacterium]